MSKPSKPVRASASQTQGKEMNPAARWTFPQAHTALPSQADGRVLGRRGEAVHAPLRRRLPPFPNPQGETGRCRIGHGPSERSARDPSPVRPGRVLQGGPRARLLKDGPVSEIEREVRDLLTVPANNGKLVLREGNNLASCTPPEHLEAMYGTAPKYGRYD